MSQDPPAWHQVFDALAPVYDQSGVPFFGPIAEGLAGRLRVAAGERVAELGAGRGALTVPLADAVGPAGRVDAVDISAEMVALTAAATAGLPQVSVAVGDAADPPLAPGSYDVAAASLVLFFLPDPVAGLRRWRDLVVPGGRAGVTTFAAPPPSWAAMERIFDETLRDTGQAEGLRGGPGPFGSDAGVEGLFDEAGWRQPRSEVTVLDVPFQDIAQWQVWMQGTALRAAWLRLDPEGRERVLSRMGDLLAAEGGRLQVGVRHTLASR